MGRFRVDVPAVEVERLATSSEAVLGGFGAVVAHLQGVNPIVSDSTVLFYGDPCLPDLPSVARGEGTERLVAEPDRFLSRYYRVTPFCQAYADLFSMPGWQAARFVGELHIQKVAASDEPLLLV